MADVGVVAFVGVRRGHRSWRLRRALPCRAECRGAGWAPGPGGRRVRPRTGLGQPGLRAQDAPLRRGHSGAAEPGRGRQASASERRVTIRIVRGRPRRPARRRSSVVAQCARTCAQSTMMVSVTPPMAPRSASASAAPRSTAFAAAGSWGAARARRRRRVICCAWAMPAAVTETSRIDSANAALVLEVQSAGGQPIATPAGDGDEQRSGADPGVQAADVSEERHPGRAVEHASGDARDQGQTDQAPDPDARRDDLDRDQDGTGHHEVTFQVSGITAGRAGGGPRPTCG